MAMTLWYNPSKQMGEYETKEKKEKRIKRRTARRDSLECSSSVRVRIVLFVRRGQIQPAQLFDHPPRNDRISERVLPNDMRVDVDSSRGVPRWLQKDVESILHRLLVIFGVDWHSLP